MPAGPTNHQARKEGAMARFCDVVSPPLSELAQRAALAQVCEHCARSTPRIKMKRQYVHYFPDTGRIIVCVEVLKPASA